MPDNKNKNKPQSGQPAKTPDAKKDKPANKPGAGRK